MGLREDTPLPIAASLGARPTLAGIRADVGKTQELDPNDILEVQDMAAAIARAEMLLASPPPPRSGRPDIFETLGRRATDDTAGPATPAPPYAALPTPIPPAPTPSAPRYVTMPSALTGAEDDAFYHPVGRMRSLADVTLDGYRPEPTLLVRAASRRKRFSWIMVAVLLPLLVLAGIAIFASTEGATSSSPKTTTATTTLSLSPRSPSTATAGRTPLATSSAIAKAPSAHAADGAGAGTSAPPLFDVNSLPSARGSR